MARASTASPTEILAGLVERVTYHNSENALCVLRVKARGQPEPITVVTHAAMISSGEFVHASGSWSYEHPWCPVQSRVSQGAGADHDRGHPEISQFRHDPRHRVGICQELVRASGEAVFEVIAQEPGRLREVTGDRSKRTKLKLPIDGRCRQAANRGEPLSFGWRMGIRRRLLSGGAILPVRCGRGAPRATRRARPRIRDAPPSGRSREFTGPVTFRLGARTSRVLCARRGMAHAPRLRRAGATDACSETPTLQPTAASVCETARNVPCGARHTTTALHRRRAASTARRTSRRCSRCADLLAAANARLDHPGSERRTGVSAFDAKELFVASRRVGRALGHWSDPSADQVRLACPRFPLREIKRIRSILKFTVNDG